MNMTLMPVYLPVPVYLLLLSVILCYWILVLLPCKYLYLSFTGSCIYVMDFLFLLNKVLNLT